MPPTFPCPNPVCTQVFNADAVQGASSLVLPALRDQIRVPPPGRRQAAGRPCQGRRRESTASQGRRQAGFEII